MSNQQIPPEALEKIRDFVAYCERMKEDAKQGKPFQFLKDPIPLTDGKGQIWMVIVGLAVLNPVLPLWLGGMAWVAYKILSQAVQKMDELGGSRGSKTGNSREWIEIPCKQTPPVWEKATFDTAKPVWSDPYKQAKNDIHPIPKIGGSDSAFDSATIWRIIAVVTVVGLYWAYRNGLGQEEIGAMKQLWDEVAAELSA